jgi:hypothetical protein
MYQELVKQLCICIVHSQYKNILNWYNDFIKKNDIIDSICVSVCHVFQ